MKDALILYNEELTSDSFQYQYESYKKSFEKIGVTAKVCPTSEYVTALFKEGQQNINVDAVIFLDKDISAAALLEAHGIKVFNSSECIRVCDDKALTYLALYKKGLPIPKTIIAPKIYSEGQNEKWCKKAVEILGFPVVIKECFGSLGMQVYLAENEDKLIETVRKIGAKPFLLQKFLPRGAGWDIRVITAGDEVIGAIKRSNLTDFRANAALGGKTEPVSLNSGQKKLALKAAEATGAFFAGVDLIMGEDDFAVCEVNSNMLFEAADKKLGISVSDIIAEKIKNIV